MRPCPDAAAITRRLNFQVALGFGTGSLCGVANTTCWGADGQPGQWLHYIITTNAAAAQLVRCRTAAELDPMPAGFAGCRVLANDVNGGVSLFSLDAVNRTATMTLQIAHSNSALPTGNLSSSLLTARINLRN
ncbi:MAG: hypothetical protein HYT88_02395 [Candidatus Omnitrophica bacterium]|nr:hypothetical protein [Candidatus Omnitrophota bacterium]